MPNAKWTLTPGLLNSDEDSYEWNPEGYWLGNTEVNQIFIMSEDLRKVGELISNAYALENI